MCRLWCWLFGHKTETESVFDIPLGLARAQYGDEYFRDGFLHMECYRCTRCYYSEYEPVPIGESDE